MSEEKILNEALDLAREKIGTGNEPPWAWYQYMKLIETIEAILKGMQGTAAHAAARPELRVVGKEEKQEPIEVNLPI